MAKYESKDLRNIALCGQLGAGKTILAEAMLLKAGLIPRLGSIADGTTMSDFDPEEKSRQYSVNSTLLHCSYAKKEFNIIDTPGGIDFFGGQISGITGADIAVICVNASKGIEVVTRKAWDLAGDLGRARILVITHMDAENIVYNDVLESIQKTFGKKCVPFAIPQGEGGSFSGVVDVFGKDVPADLVDQVEALRLEITECAVEADDAMMEKYLEEGEISAEEFSACLSPAIAKGMMVPVYCVAAAKDLGVEELMNGIANNAPGPDQVTIKALIGEGEGAEETTFTPDANAPLLAQVFKTISDPHVGKLCFARIYNGTLAAKSSATISSTGKAEKIGHLYRYNGEKHEEIVNGTLGDIVTIAKVDALNTGDIIYSSDNKLRMPPIAFPKPMVGLAIVPKTHGDEGKIGTVLHRLAEEDPTFVFETDKLTKELVMRGMGTIQLDVVLSRMKNRFNVEVNTKPPKIPYLETISAKADAHYRHKKQSGGAGQFAEVYFHVAPNERGAGFEFVNSIVGGAISQSFVGSTEKGVIKGLEKGPLAGYPVVDIIVEVYDGKEHPVDSKDIAFQTAGRNALYDGMEKAKPILLEPIVNMEIVFPSEYTGDINGDISGRRGRPTGMESFGDMQMIKAQVPLAEVADYGANLKAITRGEGFFSMELSHYEGVPSNIAQAVIAKLKAEAEEKK
ncbi:MAG: elongation factor G [Planctomycetes bacterium]|nr:elongation factor G [Planctomycetota bacterium]